MHVFRAAWAGPVAMAACHARQRARVMGQTSQGVFLAPEHGAVVFVTPAANRGPLTINVALSPNAAADLAAAGQVQLGGGALVAGGGLRVTVPATALWEPPRPPEPVGGPAGALRRAGAFSAALEAHVGSLVPLVSAAASLAWRRAPVDPGPDVPLDLPAVLAALARGDAAGLAGRLVPALGAGRGLTPTGDDFVSGLLVTLIRWPDAPAWPSPARAQLSEVLVRSAEARSPTLSASLLACAAKGWADEFLLQVVDGVIAPGIRPSAAARLIAGWGATSGQDFWAGVLTTTIGLCGPAET